MFGRNGQCFAYILAITGIAVVGFLFTDVLNPLSAYTRAGTGEGVASSQPSGSSRPVDKPTPTDANISAHGCTFPVLPLWPPEMKHLFKGKPARIKCSSNPDWTYTRHGIFYIRDTAVKTHGIITCTHGALKFQNDFNIFSVRAQEPISNGSLLKYDYFSVRCVASNKKVYNNFHAAIPLLPLKNNTSYGKDGIKPLNVIMLTFDSVSRLNWIRNLPKTHSYFVNTLGATVLQGYNIMGDGTGGALFPILTGRWKTELPNAVRGVRGAVTVDRYPWVWTPYKERGYSVMYAEDGAHIGMWTYQRKGFAKKPVDHYMRIFYKVIESRYGYGGALCLGSTPRHMILLNHIRDYLETNQSPKFGYLFHNQLSHDSYRDISKIDDDLKAFLKSLSEDGLLNNTVFILNSDHGARFTNIRRVLQGKWEERLPYFAIYLPKWFKEKYPDYNANLRENSRHLATTFDVHETLRHLANPADSPPHNMSSLRGRSLFTKIPRRTCEDGQIPPHYCTCMEWLPLDVTKNNTVLNKISSAFIDYINSRTQPYRHLCAMLNISKIDDAKISMPRKEILKYKGPNNFSDKTKVNVFFYQLRIVTSPNHGTYELTTRYNTVDQNITIENEAISRIDPYGTQPHCVSNKDRRLNFYCFCKS